MTKLKALIAIADENRNKFVKAIGARNAQGVIKNPYTYTLLIHPDEIPWDELKSNYNAFCFGYRCLHCPNESFRFCKHNKLRSQTGEDIRREQLKDAAPALSMNITETKVSLRKKNTPTEPVKSSVTAAESVVSQHKGRSRTTLSVTIELTQMAITRYDQGELLTVICKDLNVNPNEMSKTMKDLGVIIRKGKRN